MTPQLSGRGNTSGPPQPGEWFLVGVSRSLGLNAAYLSQLSVEFQELWTPSPRRGQSFRATWGGWRRKLHSFQTCFSRFRLRGRGFPLLLIRRGSHTAEEGGAEEPVPPELCLRRAPGGERTSHRSVRCQGNGHSSQGEKTS